MLFALRFVSGELRSGATLLALSLITFVAGENVRKCPLSRRFSPNELLPVMSLYAISAVPFEPRDSMPVPFWLMPFRYAAVTAVWLIPEPEPAEPQSMDAFGVLAFGPNALVVTPQVLSWTSLWRMVRDTAE